MKREKNINGREKRGYRLRKKKVKMVNYSYYPIW